ncbi:MAG: hypothetical protein AB7S26_22995 [Sandaracinaceae bacterium]
MEVHMRVSPWLSRVTCVFWVCAGMATLLVSGCLERKTANLGPNVGFGQEVSLAGGGVSSVDVLFVIDNSGSMEQEQARLASQIGRLVRDLASPPDNDGDGRPDWNAVEALRIGITTTDVGTGGSTFCAGDGDDGQLRGGVFTFAAGDDADAYASSIAAVVDSLGTRGCGYEQPIEAAARAVNHGAVDAASQPFPASEGLFAVIFVTDEEDCSVADDASFFGSAVSGAFNVHCTRNAGSLTPLSELVDQIRGARPTDDLVFAAIAGVPTDLDPNLSPAQILGLDLMGYVEVLEGSELRLRPVCQTPNPAGGEPLTRADPGRRFVELAQLVPDTVLTTICAEDFGPAIAEIAARIGAKVDGVCLVREVPIDADGTVPCEITVTLPSGSTCEAFGYRAISIDADGLAVCEILQVTPGDGDEGFYYDPDAIEGCAQLALTAGAQPPLGAAVDAQCFFELELPNGELCARGDQCASGFCDPIADACADMPGGTVPPPLGP